MSLPMIEKLSMHNGCVADSAPEVDPIVCKGLDGGVQVLANLHVDTADLRLCSLPYAPLLENFL